MLGNETIKDLVASAKTISMSSRVIAEWNHNVFNPPYITKTGSVSDVSITTTNSLGSAITHPLAPTEHLKPGFETSTRYYESGQSFELMHTLSVTKSTPTAFKIVQYIKTDSTRLLIINNSVYRTGVSSNIGDKAYGASSYEINSYGWTKIETFFYLPHTTSTNYSLRYSIVGSYIEDNPWGGSETARVYFTPPVAVGSSPYEYRNKDLWPIESVFNSFRPGESYIGFSDIDYQGDNFRRISTQVRSEDTLSSGFYGDRYMPITPIYCHPKVATFTNPVDPLLKTTMASDISSYKFHITDLSDQAVYASWAPSIPTNKIVIKFHTTISTPTVQVKVTFSNGQFDVGTFTPDDRGILTLYYGNTNPGGDTIEGIKTEKYPESIPTIEQIESLPQSVYPYFNLQSIEITKVSSVLNNKSNSSFSSLDLSSEQQNELQRLSVIEISPRLEVDFTDYVKSFSINKSLSSESDFMPIGSIDSNDASVTLANIPIIKNLMPLNLFTAEKNYFESNKISSMIGKNIKFGLFYNVTLTANENEVVEPGDYGLIVGGIFYSDTWQESDEDITIQMFDISKHLQTLPAPDYVAQYRSAIDIVMDVLDLAGFTDYDYDSLYYSIKNSSVPVDMAYFFCNSKEKTVFDVLKEIFIAYQIGAHVDEYGVMKFISTPQILNSGIPVLSLTDDDIADAGMSIQTKQRPGSISISYSPPKIKQSASLKNVTNQKQINSPSYIITTSNDVLWQQEDADSVGFNYLLTSIEDISQNYFTIDASDLLDIFKTFSIDYNGYAIIEGEIVTFSQKEFILSSDGSASQTVTAKNNLELQGKISEYVKKYQIFRNDVQVTFTGNIVNIKRGLFGTKKSPHKIISSSLSTKDLSVTAFLNSGGGSGDSQAYVDTTKDRIYIYAN